MAVRIPAVWEGEYRGVKQGGEFTDRGTGERVEYKPKFKFEVEDRYGDVGLVAISENALDRCEPPVEAATLTKGQRWRVIGNFVMGDGDERSYFSPTEMFLLGADGEPAKARPSTAAAS